MSSQPDATERPLDVLDIGPDEERVYRWLLTCASATTQDIARKLALTARRTQRLLDTLEAQGLVTFSPQRPRRYVASSPDMAVEALVLQRLDKLQRARHVIQEMQEQATRFDQHEQLVELITSREADRQAFEHIQRTAQDEILGLMRLPILVTRVDQPVEVSQNTQRDAQSRGVRFRSIVDTPFMEAPGVAERILCDVKSGEDIRVVSSLPLKLVIADRKVAFIPLNLERPDSPSLLVRSSALVDALYALFEILWQRAVPIDFASAVAPGVDDAALELSEQSRKLLSLLASGLADKVVAHELGVSASTLNRRIVDIMATLGASTRFQLGWLAALRLSGKSPPPL